MKPNMRVKLSAVLVLACCIAAGSRAEPGKTGYSLAVVPQFPATILHQNWTPVIERLKRETGLSFSLSIAPSIPQFEDAVLAGEPDFAYMNPYHQVMAMRTQGYIPLVRDSQPLKGILVVRKDDPIKSVRELDGKDIAFPAPNAFGASLWIRAILTEREKIRFVPVYVKTHSNAYRYTVVGKSAASGGINHTLAEEPEEIRSALRVLLETPDVPPHPLSAHPRVPEKLRRAVASALLGMANDAAGQRELRAIEMSAPVRADHSRDYQPLEKYGFDKYVVRAGKP